MTGMSGNVNAAVWSRYDLTPLCCLSHGEVCIQPDVECDHSRQGDHLRDAKPHRPVRIRCRGLDAVDHERNDRRCTEREDEPPEPCAASVGRERPDRTVLCSVHFNDTHAPLLRPPITR